MRQRVAKKSFFATPRYPAGERRPAGPRAARGPRGRGVAVISLGRLAIEFRVMHVLRKSLQAQRPGGGASVPDPGFQGHGPHSFAANQMATGTILGEGGVCEIPGSHQV